MREIETVTELLEVGSRAHVSLGHEATPNPDEHELIVRIRATGASITERLHRIRNRASKGTA